MMLLRKIGLITLFLLVTACTDQDPFGFSQRKIAGDYSLKQWEDFKTYYLYDSKQAYNDFEDLGPIGGTIEKIAWNKKYIIIERKSHFGGVIDGWMVVNVLSKKVIGPIPFKNTHKYTEGSTNLQIFSAKDAWKNL